MGKSKKNNGKNAPKNGNKTNTKVEVGTEVETTDDTGLPLELELLLMAFENYKNHMWTYPEETQLEAEAILVDMQNACEDLVKLLRGFEQETIEEVTDEHPIDCHCVECINDLVEKEAAAEGMSMR